MDRTLRIILTVVASFVVFSGLLAFALYAVLAAANPSEESLQIATIVGAVAALHLGLGGAILYQSIRALQGARSRSFNPPLLILTVAFLVVLGAGTGALALGRAAVIVFPFLHLLALALPALAILAIVPRWGVGMWRKGRPALASAAASSEESTLSLTLTSSVSEISLPLTWRSITGHLAFGAFASTFFAISLEVIIGAILGLFLLLAIFGNQEGDTLRDLVHQVQTASNALDSDLLRQLFLSPAILVGLVAMFVVVAPLTEEFFKSLGVALFAHRLSSPLQAWTYGLAAGLGFAMVESLFYAGVSLSSWWATTLVRIGTALIHALGTGLMGLGWYYALRRGLPWRVLGTFAASVGLHGLWNGISLGLMVAAVVAYGRISDELIPQEALSSNGTLVLGLTAVLLLLAAGAFGSIVLISRRLQRA